jgi:HD-GYP domain-containing protein (c-di-GMP phosphodiesterase class II)
LRRTAVKNLKNGMELARTIMSQDGRILLHSGIVLNETYIKRLIELGISSVYIKDEIFGDYEVQDVISEKTRLEAIKVITNNINWLKKNHNLNIRAVKNVVDSIISELLDNRNLLINLSDIRCFDDYTFAHSVNVCTLSILVGITMNYDITQLSEIGIGALLHDIGKIKIDIDILNKPSTLTREEYKQIKLHPGYGFEILRNYNDIPLLSSHVAFQHHEHWNGQGYPRKLGGTKINKYARIVAVTDSCDALLSDRPYRLGYSLNHTSYILKRMSGIQLDPDCVTALMANIAVYPIGTIVKLNTGDIGIIVDVNRDSPTRPIIRIVFNSYGRRLSELHEVDLSKFSSIVIVKILNETDVEALVSNS